MGRDRRGGGGAYIKIGEKRGDGEGQGGGHTMIGEKRGDGGGGEHWSLGGNQRGGHIYHTMIREK